MGANAFEYNVKLNLNAETKLAKAQIGELQKELQSISQLKISTAGIDKLTDEIHEASNAALTLQANLQNALNPQTGNLDFTKFISSINKSGNSVEDLAESLLKVGPSGSKAFMSLADSISRAEIPLTRTNKLINGLWDNLKKTAGWQVSSSVIHGIMGQYQQAMGYAQALDKSLTDIRIVTGQSADQMARFAKEANAAAKKLSTTTTDYTNASLIYYQQGLSDSEVKKRSDITIKMANATGTTASKVSDQLTSIWNNFDNGTKSLEHYADVMTALGAATASSTDEIAKGIQKFAAISDTVGLSYEYAASALATITATTRESADTVGNSLKTLFSRIQGLQLGETLDDGTTLNKYSTALAKVGISIKDSSGALRDMNSILDDMGSKWHTLAEDQQMALAQTVGGVRQYTQIMTLMENWDFFKENLNTANTSSGALTMQAEIYADSWEAAQKRFRASMEGMWDSLIDSDGFKSLLNLGSTIVDGITNAIQGLGGTTGIIHTLGGILGNVFNTQISTAIENGIHNIGAIIDPKGTKQRAVDQQQAILQRMSDTVRSSGGYIDADGLEGKTYENVLKKQAQETVDRERHRSMMMEENIDLDVKYEEQLKEIRQKKIDSARQIDQGKAQFDSALDSFDSFETQADKDIETKTIDEDVWEQRLSNYSKVQAAMRGNAEDSESYNKVRSQLLSSAAIMSGQILGDNLNFEKEIQSWANRTLNTESEFNDILTQFRDGTAKRTEAEIKAGQVGKDYRLDKLTSDLEKTFSILLGGGIDSKDQGIATANRVFQDQLSNAIKDLQKNGLIDPEGKILAGHETEVIDSLSATLGTMRNNANIFNRERIVSQIKTEGGKLSVDAAYQGALEAGRGRKIFNQAEQDEAQKEADRQALESRTASTISSLVRGTAGLASTTAGLQGFESAFKSDNLFSAITGIGSGILNLKTGKQSYVQGLTDFETTTDWLKGSATRSLEARKEAILQSDQAKYEKYSTDIENIKTRLQKERGTLSGKQRLELLQELGEKQKQRRELDFDPKKVSGPLKSIQQQLNEVDSSKFSKGVTKLSTAFGKLYEGKPEEVAEKINKLSGAFQAAQIAMKITSQGLEYIYNINQRNATKAATAASQLENAYAMNQRNHSALLAGIDEYNKATEKLTDTNLRGAEKSAAIYDQNQSAMDLIMKYGLSESDYSRMGDTIKINEDALRQAEEDSIERMSVSKYAMNAAKVNAKKEQNDYQEERLEREMGYDEKIAHGVAIGAAGLVAGGVMLGVKSGAILGSIAGPVGTAIGAAAGAAVGLVVGGIATAVTNGAKEDSIVDKAVSLTRETGSTAWMDDEDAVAKSGLSERQLKKIKDQRKEIERLAESEYAAEQADRVEKENTANDIIRTNEQLKDFKHADKLQEGLIKQQEDWYSKENMETYNFWDTKKNKIDVAKSLEADLGLGGEQVTWTDNWRNGQLTYTTASGQTGVLDYETMSRMEAAKKGKEGTDDYVDTMMDAYNTIKAATGNEDAAAGILSLLSGGDFESATIKEIDEAKKLLQGLTDDQGNFINTEASYDKIAKQLGIYDENQMSSSVINEYAQKAGYANGYELASMLANSQNYSTSAVTALDVFRDQNKKVDEWFEGDGKQIYESMSQSTLKSFYGKLTQVSAVGGEGAAENFLNSLTTVLNEADIDVDDYGKAMESLLALDWSSADIDTNIIEVLESLGGEIDLTSASFENLINVMKNTNLAIPDFESKMNQLSQLYGSINNLKMGDKLSAEDFQGFKEAGYDLSEYTMKQWDGSYTILGDLEDIEQKIHDNLLNTYDEFENYADIYEKYFGEDSLYHFNDDTFKNLDLSQLNWLFEAKNGPTYAGADVYNKVSYLEDLGLNGEGIQALYDEQQTAANLVNKYKLDAEGKVIGYYNDTNKDGIINSTEMTDDNVTMYSTNAEKIGAQADYDAAALRYNTAYSAGQAIIADIEAQTTKDWESLTKEQRQQVASTYNTLDKFEASKNDGRGIIYDANGNLTEEGQEQLKNLALQYPELTEYVEAYNNALASKNETAIESAETAMKEAIAMQEALATYTTLTGKKIDLAKLQDTMDKLREDMGEDGVEYSGTEEELADLAAQVLVAADAYGQLSKNSAQWIANLGEDSYKAKEAAQNLGKYLEIVLGLNDLEGITPTDWIEVIETAEEKLKDVGGLSAVIRGDRRAGLEFGELLARRANGGTLEQAIQQQKNANGGTSKLEEAIDTMQSWFVDNGIEGFSDLGGLNEEQQAAFKKNNEEIWNESGGDWETYQAATEAAGYTVSRQDFQKGTSAFSENGTYESFEFRKDDITGENVWVGSGGTTVEAGDDGTYGGLGNPLGEGQGNASVNSAGQYYRRTGGGGGGGGGPTKVQVKSAQDLMTRYKVIDQKTTINDMQKTAALQAKDLLYGQSKINQLNTINTLLRKQQQLTADRITEELDYLEKDKKKIEELIERYNKDAKDEDKINLEFDGFGIITNYKQVIGKWAEEVASYYADGELTAEEGKKAEEYQKKIQDFNTVIKDYEDSLNQLMTSIETYENTLYEMFSNQMETLTYKVQYKIELEQDDLSYMDFYASSIKDSYSMMYTYLELIGSKIGEITGQMEIYQGGYEDLINSVENDPLQLWATQGVEGILTADQIETARSYRDSMIDLYQSAIAARKEIEEQVLRVFDEWNDKINKNITGISRFTDMLSQFKDIINIVGKDVLGISDAFMKTFEQKSINQSMDNIAASKSQYENLVKTYEQSQAKLLAAQERLEAAKASGDEGVIATAERDVEYWEGIADKTQEEMQSAEDTMLTTLNHTLTMISEQFTNAITEAVDNFNESIYQFNGLEGLVSDYELIREQKDLMVEDYEKIYSLSKLNRDIEKSLNNSNILSGKQKLLGLQKEINELTQNNVELSRYDLEYLQAKYELKLAEMELDNAKNSKDTVRLTKDSEGNWSYIYTQNASVVEEAEQKVEDSLFRMQQLSQQYTEEMSSAMMSITQAMRDEMSALSIQDFESPEAFQAEMDRIQEKYSAQIAHREEELNKSIENSSSLYEQDWANYSAITGYKMSADQDWVDSFNETTLGGLLGSSSDVSNYSTLIADSTNKMNEALGKAASTYFVNADKALTTYGSSLKTFGSQVSTTTNNIVSQSTKAVKEVSDMGSKLVTEFETITDTVEEDLAEWAEEIGNTLTELLDQIVEINNRIAESAKKSIPETTEMIGQEEAAELLQNAKFNNSAYSGWEWDGNRAVHNGKDIVEFNGELVEDVNAALQAYANTKVGSPEREAAAEELRKVIADYWTFKKILERIYDPTNIDIEEIETPDVTEMATGGYTGEWGSEGKYAVLHEKELVLNQDDTANFLNALNVSKQLIEMIEMNARASSLGLGEMHAATIQDSIQTLEQQVNITAEFPDATDHNEIKEAFDNLVNTASQYANRYRD